MDLEKENLWSPDGDKSSAQLLTAEWKSCWALIMWGHCWLNSSASLSDCDPEEI